MKIKRLLIGMICVLFLSGCGEVVEEVASSIQPTSEDNSASGVKTTTPVSGGTLNMSMHSPKTLNPLLNEDVTVDRALKLVFEPLFVLDSEQQVVPNLADGYLLSPDGMSMAVTLKNDIKWHDGVSVSADDIIFSIDTIRNASADSIYKSTVKNIVSCSKSSESTVVIKYGSPSGGCEYDLCFPIVPKHYYNGQNSTDSDKNLKPIGNGLYKFESYRLSREMKLVKVGNFKGSSYIDNINVIIMPDKETEINALEQGVIDVLETDLSSWGKFNSTTKVNSTSFNSNQFEFLGFNFSNPIFANKSVRQAVAYGVPYNDIENNIYLGNVTQSITPINPGSWLSALSGVDNYDYDINKVKATITNANLTKEQLTFTILVNEENSERIEIAALIASSLNQAGMNVTVDKQNFESYKNKLDTDQFDMFIGGVQFLEKLDMSKFLASSGQASPGINYFNFSDAQMDNLINTASNAKSEESYKTAIGEVERYCSRQLPCIGLGFKSSILLTSQRLEGLKLPVVNNVFVNFEDWFIDKTGEGGTE